MRLPNADLAIVEREKIVDYLLNPAHPENGGKAGFFFGQGFTTEGWRTLAAALRKAAKEHPITLGMASPHGRKYVIECPIETPGGRTPRVRMVWIIDAGLNAPRLVTVYPRN